MKNVERVRAEVVADVSRMLEHLRVRWSLYLGDDLELLGRIDRSRHPDLTVLLANALMRELGDARPGPREPRYDRTRRVVNEQRLKPPRGIRAALTKGERRRLKAGGAAPDV